MPTWLKSKIFKRSRRARPRHRRSPARGAAANVKASEKHGSRRSACRDRRRRWSAAPPCRSLPGLSRFSSGISASSQLEAVRPKRSATTPRPCFVLDLQRVSPMIDALLGVAGLGDVRVFLDRAERGHREVFGVDEEGVASVAADVGHHPVRLAPSVCRTGLRRCRRWRRWCSSPGRPRRSGTAPRWCPT